MGQIMSSNKVSVTILLESHKHFLYGRKADFCWKQIIQESFKFHTEIGGISVTIFQHAALLYASLHGHGLLGGAATPPGACRIQGRVCHQDQHSLVGSLLAQMRRFIALFFSSCPLL